jgi:hypothetical protein
MYCAMQTWRGIVLSFSIREETELGVFMGFRFWLSKTFRGHSDKRIRIVSFLVRKYLMICLIRYYKHLTYLLV